MTINPVGKNKDANNDHKFLNSANFKREQQKDHHMD